MEQAAVQLGAVLAGRYRVDRVIGQGGMGVVVQAMHLQLHQPVAIKFLLPEVLINQQIVQRFVREAQAAVRLRSEHVARVIDVGTLETGAPYMVLEYLDGCDLSNYPRAQLTVGVIVDLLLQACEALAEAHSLGIVHRDIKPANFFITRRADGSPLLKVLDFGISKMPVADNNLTATQTVMGTPAYMSPEQMKSARDVDHRSDIWSLGIVLYELLQGAPPFGGETFSSMVLRVVTEALPRLTIALPPGLDAIIYRCLEKDPANRFQRVGELAQALAPYAGSMTQAAISVQRTGGATGVTGGAAGTQRSLAAGGKRRWPLLAGAGALAGAIAVIAILAAQGSGGASEAAPAAREPEATATSGPGAASEPAPASSGRGPGAAGAAGARGAVSEPPAASAAGAASEPVAPVAVAPGASAEPGADPAPSSAPATSAPTPAPSSAPAASAPSSAPPTPSPATSSAAASSRSTSERSSRHGRGGGKKSGGEASAGSEPDILGSRN